MHIVHIFQNMTCKNCALESLFHTVTYAKDSTVYDSIIHQSVQGLPFLKSKCETQTVQFKELHKSSE